LSFISLTPDDNALLKAIVRRGCAEDGILEKLYVNSLQWHPNVYVNFLKALTELLYKSTTLQELAIPFHPWDEENFAIAINNNSLKKITLVIQNFDCIYAICLIELLQAIKKILEIEMYFSKLTIYYKEPKIFTLFYPQTDPVIKARLLSNISRAQEKLLEKFRFNNDIWLYRTPKLVELAASKAAKSGIVCDTKVVLYELCQKVENYRGFWSKQNKRPPEDNERQGIEPKKMRLEYICSTT